MVYFTSDLHLGHRGIIEMQNRPFGDVREMNRVLIQNYNAVVNKNDTVSLNGIHSVLMYYPMLSWPKKTSGSIQLHGHIHAREAYNLQNRDDGIRRYDVGVDANHYFPVSVKQIVEFFSSGQNRK